MALPDVTTRRSFVRGSLWGLIAGAGGSLSRRDEPRLADRLAVPDHSGNVVLFQLMDCPSLRGELGRTSLAAPKTVGRLLGADGLPSDRVREVLQMAGITMPVRRIRDAGLGERLRSLGYAATPIVLRFGTGGRLLRIEAPLHLVDA